MTKIEDFKDRMTSPLGMVRIDPKTGKPITKTRIEDYADRFDSPMGAVEIDPKTGKPIKKKDG